MSDYFKLSTAILFGNFSYLYILMILGMGICAPTLISASSAGGIFVTSFIGFIIVYPLIYGRFIDILSGRALTPWLEIYQNHWVNFMVVQILMIVMFLPVVFLVGIAGIPVMSGLSVISILVNVTGIYIFPLVYLTREKVPSITLGLKCLTGNFQFTIPMIIAMLLPIVVGMMVPQDATPASSVLAFGSYMVNVVIDFIVFISASMILRDKLGV